MQGEQKKVTRKEQEGSKISGVACAGGKASPVLDFSRSV